MLVLGLILKKSVVKRYYIRFSQTDCIYGSYIPFVTPQPLVNHQNKHAGVMYKEAPGPIKYPIIGSLYLMGQDKYPFQALTKLKEEYGNVISLRLGTTDCISVSDEWLIHQVLIERGEHFDARPNFLRFHLMFGGSKQNALAFCDYDEIQKIRKNLLAAHTFPRRNTLSYDKLDQIIFSELDIFLEHLNQNTDIKLYLSKVGNPACSNIFNGYFCDTERKDYTDLQHNKYVDLFDKVFWEVNNGRAVDFIPELMILMQLQMLGVKSQCRSIRKYVMDVILQNNLSSDQDNLVGSLFSRVEEDKTNEDPETTLNRECALYALEDILGGHCAVSNITIRMLRDITDNPKVQEKLRAEIEKEVGAARMSSYDVGNIHYLKACFHETLRTTCSAIVPHMANSNTTLGDYFVPKDTVVIINNHYTNFSETLWTNPEEYNPDRFIDQRTGKFMKPSHFQPFSSGRRSCIGYKIVTIVTTGIIAAIIRNKRVESDIPEIPVGFLALPTQPYFFQFSSVQQ